MTTSMVLRDYRVLEEENKEDLVTLVSAVKSLKTEFVSKLIKPAAKDYDAEFKKLLTQTIMGLKKCANLSYKEHEEIEVDEILQIKAALSNFANDDSKIKEFKNSLLNDLDNFQSSLRQKKVRLLEQLKQEQRGYIKKAKELEIAKNKLIMDRLSNILWPYDEKTKSYDKQIEQCKIQLANCIRRIHLVHLTKATADTKDLMLYEMKMKEKYSYLF